ncbi:MAG TPA: NUDIX domain-containing protein [Candidatus Acidoferrum sp.]|nr:NUDIX domain-containing protein [Candidatus Acidoferrum sp.]
MPKKSAGLLLYRERNRTLEVFLVHPGGPFWEKKDDGAWSIPKGEFGDDEDALDAARREFAEETGIAIEAKLESQLAALTPLKQHSGKIVHAWIARADFDADSIRSNTFSLEWPPRSGKQQQFPEVDRAAWFDLPTASRKILKGQRPFLQELQQRLPRVHRSV